MAKEKSPAYQHYPKDYLTDENVAVMSLEHEGAYRRLMDHCWLEGSIPDELRLLAALCRTSPAKMAKLWPLIAPCFDAAPILGGRLIHARLERERLKQAHWKHKSSEGGHKSQALRKQSATTLEPIGQPTPDIAVRSLQSPTPVTDIQTAVSTKPAAPPVEPVEAVDPQKARFAVMMPLLRKHGFDCDQHDGSILKVLFKKGVKDADIEAAVVGLAIMRDSGQLERMGLSPGDKLSMRILYAASDGKKPIWTDASAEYYRQMPKSMKPHGMKNLFQVIEGLSA